MIENFNLASQNEKEDMVETLIKEMILLLSETIDLIEEYASGNIATRRELRDSYQKLENKFEELKKIEIEDENENKDIIKVFLEKSKKIDMILSFEVSSKKETEETISYIYSMVNKLRKIIRK